MGRVQPPTHAPSPFTGAGGIADAQTLLVWTKEAWTGDWVIQPNLQPIRASRQLAPTVNTATFRYNFGEHKTGRAPDFVTLAALDLQDHYVRIQVVGGSNASGIAGPNPRVPVTIWIGQLLHDGRQPAGVEPATPPNDPAGGQVFTAFGLEYLLKKSPIDRSWVYQAGRPEGQSVFSIQRQVSFNRQVTRGGMFMGNATESGTVLDTFGDPVLTFARSGIEWPHGRILDYLIHYFVNQRTAPQFKMAGMAYDLLTESAHTTVENFFGYSVWDALNKLVDRRRGLSWYVRVADTQQTPDVPVEIVVQSTLIEPIEVGDVNIPANTRQITFDVDSPIRIEKAAITASSTNQYGKVEVRGSRIRSMMTLSFADGTLEKGWTTAEETAYKDAAKDTPDPATYAGLSWRDKAKLNDRFRREDPSVAHVFRRFKVASDFDWMVSMPDGELRYAAVPVSDSVLGVVAHAPDVSADVYNADKTFMRTLLTEKRKDYSTSPVTDSNPADEVPELADPFVLVLHQLDNEWRYHDAHHMGVVSGNNLPTAGLRFLRSELGFELLLSAAMPNHAWAYARSHWNPDAVEPSLFVPVAGNSVDYDRLIITVAVATDQRPSLVVDIGTGLVGDNELTLVIDVLDIHFWSVVRPTIVGVYESRREVKFIHRDNLVIRDDTARMRQIAQFAQAWYGRVRRSIDITMASPLVDWDLGSMVLSISLAQSQVQTNSVLSTVEWDFLEHMTHVSTDFVELDLAAIFRGNVSVSGGGGEATPSLGPMRTVSKSLVERVDQLEAALENAPVHVGADNVGFTDGFIGKIVSWHEDLCHVARMEFGDPHLWAARTFTGENNPAGPEIIQCVWKGVGTAIDIGHPVWCFKPANSSRYVAQPWDNQVGDWEDAGGSNGEFQACEPDAGSVVDPGDSCTGPIGSEGINPTAACET